MTGPRQALRPILTAGALARYRVIDVACRKDHRLLQVIQTGDGQVVLWSPGPNELLVDDPHVGVVLAGELYAHLQQPHLVWWFRPYGYVEARCRCGDASIDLAWVAGQAAAGRKRVVWTTPDDGL